MKKLLHNNIENDNCSVILKEIAKNMSLLQSQHHDSNGTIINSEYVFKQPTKLFFEMKTYESKTQLVFFHVVKLRFAKYMNLFTQCILTLTDKPTRIEFYVLDDINNLTFKIGEDNARTIK
ncbi:MAG: hypothetical protein BZ138_08180 [Methanosphaera sp. rholeuAM270]|nr:MAG: hypothetical protein BZ138_08180 [Methanosphaera sp. rholeuAM270]